MNEPDRDPEPKIYAPLLLQLETEHPKLATLLIGVGDAPVAYDAKKREVEARFQTEAGTLFSGKYHTEPGSAREDAKEFLARMVGKLTGVLASDKAVLGTPPAVTPPRSADEPPSEDEDDDTDEDDEDEDEDEDEDATDPVPAAAQDWDEPKEPSPQ